MKSLGVFLFLCGLALNLQAQDSPRPGDTSQSIAVEPTSLDSSSDTLETPEISAHTYIPHVLEVPPFIPPPPPVVKRLPAVRVEATTTLVSKNSRILTIQRCEPSTQPDLPSPPPFPPYVELQDPTPEETARRIWHQRHNLNLGATVFDHGTSVVRWTDPQSLIRYEAVCGFDIGLLAGIGDFIHNGEKYRLFLMHSDFDTARLRRFASQWNLKIPDVSPGEILITRGDVKDTAATASINVIKEIIEVESPRLISYQAARATYIAAFSAWHAAHPIMPRDETFILRPHRGSRYIKEEGGAQP